MKIKAMTTAAALGLTIASMFLLPPLHAQTAAPADTTKTYRSEFQVPPGKHYTGRTTQTTRMALKTTPPSAPKNVPTPAPVAKSAGVSVVKSGSGEGTLGLVRLSQVVPVEVSLGSEYVTEWTLTAQGSAARVVVRSLVPAGASYVRSEPAATVEGQELIWKLGDLEAGQTVKVQGWFKAEQEGDMMSCATISAEPRVCGVIRVGKPVLTVEQTGPATALLGQPVTYQVVVKNAGTAAAKRVVVTNAVPAGLSHSSGQPEVTFDVGDLAPGQAKPVTVTFKANQRGKVCNTAVASSRDTGSVSAVACTVVLVPGLKVEQRGPKEQILMRNADYEITVTNPGDTELQNVVVVNQAPGETTIVAAPGASLSGNKATWTIASLAPGGKVTQALKLTSKTAGTHCNTVTASSSGLSETAKACTLWKGIPALTLEVGDEPDPIQVGESTTYTIKVTNQGFADVHNVKIGVAYDEPILPVSTAQGRVSGRTVSFPVVARLGAKQAVTYTVTVKGASVGDSRNKITLTADELKTPVEEDESTTVY